MSAPDSGTSTRDPFAYFDPDTSSWRTFQASLLEASDESCTTWPKQGTWDLGFAYALPTSVLPTDGIASSSLLPTPSTYESTPTDEFVDEVRENMDDPHQRLYLPGRKWHAQRTLSRMVPALLPTPVVTDSFGSRRSTARTDEWESNPGKTLTDAIWEVQGRTTDTTGKLLPTPTGDDANNVTRESGTFGSLAREAHEIGTWGRPNRGRNGVSTNPPSGDGNTHSDEPHPGQLTIKDA